MKRLKALIACVMVALWLPASMHCLFEDAGWLAKDESCASAPAGTHDQSDGCGFENGGVQFQALKVFIPVFDFVQAVLRDTEESAVPPNATYFTGRDILISLGSSWQFTCRAALPVRAPSFLS